MKLKNKLILIFIFFACFVFFNNSNCFADSTVTYNNREYSLPDINAFLESKGLSGYPYVVSHFVRYSNYIGESFVLYVPGKYGIDFSRDLYIKCYSFTNNNRRSFNTYYLDTNQELASSSSNFCFVLELSSSNPKWKSISSDTIWDFSGALEVKICYSTLDIYDIDGSLFLASSLEPETTKHDLFQLNLTDKNFNNALHTFILNTDENFVNYSEICDLIENNNKYCIYVTDYTRLLTFSDNSFNASLESSSYLLSGYIDFLVSDNAYFYFSPHYNRIKVCSGDYRGQDMSTYTKRYFFNLVYSDDSDDTYFSILDDNGLLWNLSDYVNDGINSSSDYLTDIQNSYFIGSNQTIYYANEDTNYILDSLTDSIYYGKDRGADERIYNFGFSGGNKKEFYLNEATFNNKVSSENSFIAEKSPVVSQEETFEPVIIHDESSGNSSVIPQDSTTYTYPANTVTDETTSEEDATHRQNERTSYTSTDSNDDTSNWSLWDFIKGIFGKIGNLISSIGNLVTDLISGLVSLFVPSGDFFSDTFTDLADWFELKLGFIFYPFQFFLDVFDRITNIEFGEPVISIPDIKEPFSDEIIIHAVEFNLNDLLENEGIETAHNYYLMFVDAILIIGFINLLKNKFEEVTHR